MQLPKSSSNIYPRSVENIKAILAFYFPFENHTEIAETAVQLHEKRGVDLNQLEHTAMFVAKYRNEIRKIITSQSLWNLMRDTRDALFVPSEKWEISNGTHTPKLQALNKWTKSL